MPAIEGKYANTRAKEERTPANGAETGLERASNAYLDLARTFKQPRASARIVWACIVSSVQYYEFTAQKAGWRCRIGPVRSAQPKGAGDPPKMRLGHHMNRATDPSPHEKLL